MIYVENINSIIVCSGFYSNSSEITDINKGIWNNLPNLKEVRANATMFCLNQKYVYCIGGFHVEKDKTVGTYLNSCEFIDVTTERKEWTFIDFDRMHRNLKNCAMGVLNLAPNKILLVGGYDGTKYLSETTEIDFQDGSPEIKSISPLGKRHGLSRGIIFTSSKFIRLNNKAYNFDLQSRLVIYDTENNSLNIRLDSTK